ncbi:universal stress protein [Leifsonia poae]|uniref:Universal stress protein n=1 Tax=Leifsonia poae TaxID=110933 RepID=A0A9W6H9S5_9MICO|nr:universal stress protein [Leifsonia poae]GLJ76534.1 universal stress protein [Leifsonia poae]
MDTIIAAVDGSVPSRAAVRWAAGEAVSWGAQLVLVHVVDDEWGTISDRMVSEVSTSAERLLETDLAYALSLEEDLAVSALLLEGSPMWELSRLSTADTLIAVGTHKSGFHYGRAFGSRSLQLANLASGSIAIIPESAVRFRRGVVAGVDETPAGIAAIDCAAEEAVRRGAELTLVRASTQLPWSSTDSEERHDWQEWTDDAARKTLATAVERVRERCPKTIIRSRVVRRPAGAALNELARTAELLIIGDSRRPGAQPGTLGSVAYDVLLNLTSPAIVVHAPEPARTGRAAESDDIQKEGTHHAIR